MYPTLEGVFHIMVLPIDGAMIDTDHFDELKVEQTEKESRDIDYLLGTRESV
jgi:hypothetical protein